ncbi:MAG TPA: hypothetical protein PLJ84_01135 [Bacteroidales bacterium]|nr:hypothetical protein [Bacteroidales bacterium]
MKTDGHCPVRGNTSVIRNIVAGCSAPSGAGDSSVNASFCHPFVPNGTHSTALESTTSLLVYQLYGLTKEEIRIV